MKLELDRKTMKNWFALLNDVSSECRLNANKNGIGVKIVDRANVCIINTKISNTSFLSYKCNDEAVFGIDIGLIYSKLKKIPSVFGDNIILDIDNQFTILKCGRYSFKTETLDVNTIRSEPLIPNIVDRKNSFTISTTNFYSAIATMNKHGKVRITERDGVISFISTDGGNVTEIEFTDEISIIESENSTSVYSCDYLRDITQTMKRVTKDVNFVFGTDYPCSIISNGGVIQFEYMVAPRIESD